MNAKIIITKNLPIDKYYSAITWDGVIYIRKQWWESASKEERAELIRHENFHARDEKRIGWFKFMFLYAGEFLANLPKYRWNVREAYRNISFERHARGDK